MKKRLFVLKNADGKYVSIDQIHEDYLFFHLTTNIVDASIFDTFDEAEIEAQNISNGRHVAIEEVVIETKDLFNLFKLYIK